MSEYLETMTEYLLTFLCLTSLIVIKAAAYDHQMKHCFDKLKINNITTKSISYSQLVEIGKVYGHQYCQLEKDGPNKYQCNYLSFVPKLANSNEPGLIDLFLTLPYTGVMINVHLEVFDTEIPGVFQLHEKVSRSNGRLMAVLDAKPGYLVINLCSVDQWKYNDIRIYTADKFPSGINLTEKLETYVTASCKFYETPQDNCPQLTIPLTQQTIGPFTTLIPSQVFIHVVEFLEFIYIQLSNLISYFFEYITFITCNDNTN